MKIKMTQIEIDYYNAMIQNSSEIAKQLDIANKLKRFELEMKLKEKYGLYDAGGSNALNELDECINV
jgi:hypothetical protein